MLAVAIAQVLGNNFSGELKNSHDYQFESTGNEYLYEYYFEAYKRYLDDVRSSVERVGQKHPKAVVISTDVNSFYTRIIQEQLVEKEVGEGLSTRIKWLLKKLLQVNIPSITDIEETEHDIGRGLIQGGTASGFFAKMYLRSLHKSIGAKKKGIILLRYADDITLIIPDPNDKKFALDTLNQRLSDLGLALSQSKTSRDHTPKEYLEITQTYSSDELDAFNEEINRRIQKPLFVMTSEYRELCKTYHEQNRWWEFVENYKQCLQQANIYLSAQWLSRKIQQYSTPPRDVTLLNLPNIEHFTDHFDPLIWADELKSKNQHWFNRVQSTKHDISSNLRKCWISYKYLVQTEDIKRHRSFIRFYTGRLAVLGFDETIDIMFEILKEPGLLSNAQWVMEYLARQGFVSQLLEFLFEIMDWDYKSGGYLRAVGFRSLRYLPEIPSYSKSICDLLGQGIFEGQIIEQLMSTETLIHVGCLNDFEYWRLHSLIKTGNVLHTRLNRNIFLLLGECGELPDLEHNEDPMIEAAYRIAAENQNESLVSYIEPDILRQLFYSQKYQDFEQDNEINPSPW